MSTYMSTIDKLMADYDRQAETARKEYLKKLQKQPPEEMELRAAVINYAITCGIEDNHIIESVATATVDSIKHLKDIIALGGKELEEATNLLKGKTSTSKTTSKSKECRCASSETKDKTRERKNTPTPSPLEEKSDISFKNKDKINAAVLDDDSLDDLFRLLTEIFN